MMSGPLLHAAVDIDAPIDVVWQVMVDLHLYGEWNPFIVRVDGPTDRAPRVGDVLRLHVEWSSGSGVRSTEHITRLEPPADGRALLEYEFRGPIATLGLVRGAREQSLQATGDRSTRYETREQLRGLAARLAPNARVQDGFERHAAALKARAEQLTA